MFVLPSTVITQGSFHSSMKPTCAMRPFSGKKRPKTSPVRGTGGVARCRLPVARLDAGALRTYAGSLDSWFLVLGSVACCRLPVTRLDAEAFRIYAGSLDSWLL